MQKKIKHILINLTQSEYAKIKARATKEKRTITNTTYLIIKSVIK